ncbi:MAG: PTS sugar transporter subunit IIA [Planctomycetes bacterium]|nr:PTS sugar transporter subunit IIA [Planctomycetota bacterium]
MRLGEFLRDDLIKIGMDAQNKHEAIEELIDLLISEHDIRMRDRAEILRVVMEREKSMSTGIEHGVAIPHGTTDAVDEIIGALAIPEAPIPFESCDGEPSSLILLLIIPRAKFKAHVKTLAGVAKLMSDPQFRQDLRNSKTPQDAMNTIHAYESKEFLYDFRQKT